MSRGSCSRALYAAAAAATLTVLTACGQKGALYLPDKNAAVVTSAPPAPESATAPAPTPAPAAAPASAPQAPAESAPPPPKKDQSEGDPSAPQ
jgi:predicted small lipoprotein YifL